MIKSVIIRAYNRGTISVLIIEHRGVYAKSPRTRSPLARQLKLSIAQQSVITQAQLNGVPIVPVQKEITHYIVPRAHICNRFKPGANVTP